MQITKTKLVYSACFGNYDYIKDPVKINPDWRYVMYVDQHFTGRSDFWELVVIKSNKKPNILARHVKTQPHKYFEFDYALWVDSSITVGVDPDELVGLMIVDRHAPEDEQVECDFLMKEHPDRHNMYDEIEHCININKASKVVLEKQATDYFKEGLTYDMCIGLLIETGAFLVRKSDKTIAALDMWWSEIQKHSHRDQISFPYVCWKFSQTDKLILQKFTHPIFCRWFALVGHRDPAPDIPIHYLTPYAIDGNLGKAYNEAVIPYNDDEWVCLMDGDTFFPETSYGSRIAQVIQANPKVDIFSCITNRLRDTPQLFRAKINNNTEVGHHEYISELLWLKHGTKVKAVNRPVAGLFMLAKAKVFKDVKFKNGLIWIDTDFGYRAAEKGYRVGIAEGIYVFHFYRMNLGIDNIDHLK